MNLVHSKKRASRRARLSDGRTERTVSRTQSDAYRKRKTREHETDGKATSSTTHTATKRRPAITKGPAEREADEPTREDKDDVGPSARATAGKRASTASTKVRDTVLVCLLFFTPRTTRSMTNAYDRPIAPTKPSRVVGCRCRNFFAFSTRASRIHRRHRPIVDRSRSDSIKQIFSRRFRDFFLSRSSARDVEKIKCKFKSNWTQSGDDLLVCEPLNHRDGTRSECRLTLWWRVPFAKCVGADETWWEDDEPRESGDDDGGEPGEKIDGERTRGGGSVV